MGPVWEYQWEYTDLDDGQVKLYPFWLTVAEAGYSMTLIENEARRLKHTRRERVGPPEWREKIKGKPSGLRALPSFDSPQDGELRELWWRVPDPDVHRAILEIVRVRRVIGDIAGLCETIRGEWTREVGGGLVAIHALRMLLARERRRTGEVGGKSGGAAPGDGEEVSR
ncbi:MULTISPECIES: hypothetical protein [unclassified Burkholderia]|uniref:hypothetical protein n=1 Tax=unclassified Burkholderia TaxID=2613784 RepID=UPI002AAF5B30|nr:MULTISPECIES: hypothetical protein [unclassified Burkholderia]